MAGPIVCHSLAHAVAALTAAEALGCKVTLLSAEDAAGSVGAGWFRDVIAAACAAHPGVQVRAILRCGAEAGFALAALRAGVGEIALDARPAVRARVGEIARQSGGRLVRVPAGPLLDLLAESDPDAACSQWLGGLPKT